MKKVITNYDRLKEDELLSFGRSVAEHMTGNDFFPTPEPPMPAFTENLDIYAAALTASRTGDHMAVTRKNLLNATVKGNLTGFAMYVNSVSRGNGEMLGSSGLIMVKERSRITIAQPVITSIQQGINAGSIVIKVKKVKGAKSYQYQYALETPTGRAPWVSVPDGRSKYELTELEQGKKYWFRVAAIGGYGQIVYSDEVSQYVMQRDLSSAA